MSLRPIRANHSNEAHYRRRRGEAASAHSDSAKRRISIRSCCLTTFATITRTITCAGFPWHPHRGIETITYVLAGSSSTATVWVTRAK